MYAVSVHLFCLFLAAKCHFILNSPIQAGASMLCFNSGAVIVIFSACSIIYSLLKCGLHIFYTCKVARLCSKQKGSFIKLTGIFFLAACMLLIDSTSSTVSSQTEHWQIEWVVIVCRATFREPVDLYRINMQANPFLLLSKGTTQA